MQRICLNNKDLNEKTFPVFFNAWQYEQEENPLSALTMTIFNQLLANEFFLTLIKHPEYKNIFPRQFINLAKFGAANTLKLSRATEAKISILAVK